jgi:hypothetical protein
MGSGGQAEAAVDQSAEPVHHGRVVQGREVLHQSIAATDLHRALSFGEQAAEAGPLQQIPQGAQQGGVLPQQILHLADQRCGGIVRSALVGDEASDAAAQVMVGGGRQACTNSSNQLRSKGCRKPCCLW